MKRCTSPALLLALSLGCGGAHAQQQELPLPVTPIVPAAPAPEVPEPALPLAPAGAPGPDLYLEAMQAIAEGRRTDASRTLALMQAQGPSNAGEWLDLALLQCALGRAAEAEQMFKSIEQRFAPPKGILDIIAEQRAEGCASWVPQSLWSLTAGRGYDHNVNQGASSVFHNIGDGSTPPLELTPDYLPKADGYTVLSADYARDVSQNGDTGFVQLYARHNDSLSHYNTVSLAAGLDHPLRYKRWRVRASGLVGALTLGGQLYQSQAQMQLRVTPPLPLPKPLELQLVGSIAHLNYRTLSNFDANTTELRGVLSYRQQDRSLQLSLGVQGDHALGARPGGGRIGQNAGLYGRMVLWQGLEGEADWSFQRWRGQSDYSPGIIDIARRQSISSVRAALSYPVSTSSSVQLEWRTIHNKENISIFQYDNRVLQLNWRWHGK